jgi:hypothetical protein
VAEGDCHKRMLRGGTWDRSANMLRSGYRENSIVDGGGHSFRVVRTLNFPSQSAQIPAPHCEGLSSMP